MRPLRIGIVASEAAPFAKTGGLADVCAALARHLVKRGHDVRLVMPLYERVEQGGWELTPVPGLQDIPVQLGPRRYWFSISTAPLPGSKALVWFVRCPELYRRAGIYTQDADEHVRFAMLSCAAIQLCQWSGWSPDVLHANDWHTGLLPLYLKTSYGWDRLFQKTRTVLTIHNIGYQGVVGADQVDALGLANERRFLHQERLREGRINQLELGLLYADAITTVSETYAKEIRTSELGMGLEGLLRARSSALVGIVNGVDHDVWDPRHDELIPARYSPTNMAGKARCRAALLERYGIQAPTTTPVFGIVSRLTAQKGFELVAEVMPRVLASEDVRLVVLGSGEARYERFFERLRDEHPRQVAYATGYDEKLSHGIEAGSDLFLMPSRYEPCGLNQMYSMRYGTIPIVRRTGGLADTVREWNAGTREGTGFLFDDFDGRSFGAAVVRALATWRDAKAWKKLVQNAMAQDFSWERQVLRYEELYRRLVAS